MRHDMFDQLGGKVPVCVTQPYGKSLHFSLYFADMKGAPFSSALCMLGLPSSTCEFIFI